MMKVEELSKKIKRIHVLMDSYQNNIGGLLDHTKAIDYDFTELRKDFEKAIYHLGKHMTKNNPKNR